MELKNQILNFFQFVVKHGRLEPFKETLQHNKATLSEYLDSLTLAEQMSIGSNLYTDFCDATDEYDDQFFKESGLEAIDQLVEGYYIHTYNIDG